MEEEEYWMDEGQIKGFWVWKKMVSTIKTARPGDEWAQVLPEVTQARNVTLKRGGVVP